MGINKKKSFIFLISLGVISITVCLSNAVVRADNEDSYSNGEDVYENTYSYEYSYTEETNDDYTPVEAYSENTEESADNTVYTESNDYTYSTADNDDNMYSENSYEWQYTESSTTVYDGYTDYVDETPYYSLTSESTEYSESNYDVLNENSYDEISAGEISGYEFSDNDTLTSEDWEKLKNSAQSSRIEMSGGDDAIAMIKNGQGSGNDDWVYLVWGIVLLVIGLGAVAVVIIGSVYSKKKLKRKAENSRKGYVEDIVSGTNTAKKKKDIYEGSRINSKQNTSEIIIKDIDKKDDYEDFFNKT